MIDGDKISGLLYYVTGFTAFSTDPEKQKGNYLAMSFDANPDASIEVTLINAQTTQGPTVLEPDDRDCVFRITNKDTQKIKVVASAGADSTEITYDLSGLVLEEADQDSEVTETNEQE